MFRVYHISRFMSFSFSKFRFVEEWLSCWRNTDREYLHLDSWTFIENKNNIEYFKHRLHLRKNPDDFFSGKSGHLILWIKCPLNIQYYFYFINVFKTLKFLYSLSVLFQQWNVSTSTNPNLSNVKVQAVCPCFSANKFNLAGMKPWHICGNI